jgi:hypothetical protein
MARDGCGARGGGDGEERETTLSRSTRLEEETAALIPGALSDEHGKGMWRDLVFRVRVGWLARPVVDRDLVVSETQLTIFFYKLDIFLYLLNLSFAYIGFFF